METAWLPNPTLQRRRQLQRVLLSRKERPEKFNFSEFLTDRNVLFFDGSPSKTEVVEALVGSLMGQNSQAPLQAIWARERQSALMIGPDVAILRGRLEDTHHMRAALGLCSGGVANPSYPHAKTRIFIGLIGPVDQTHLHMNLLTSLSALFRRPRLIEKLLQSNSAEKALRLLQKPEDRCLEPHGARSFLQNIKVFLNRRYGWND